MMTTFQIDAPQLTNMSIQKKPRTAAKSVPNLATSGSQDNEFSLRSPTTTITTGQNSLNSRVCFTVGNEQADQTQSAPGLVWCLHRDAKSGSIDQTAINAVVTMTVFPKVKFVDKDSELSYSKDKETICQFVIQRCNLQPEVIEAEWWRLARGFVGQTMNRLRNDRNTAMKGAALGKLP